MSLKDSCKALVAVSLLTVAVALPAYAQDTAAAPAAPAATDATAAAAPVAAPDALPSLPEADPALAGVEHQEQVDNPSGLSALWAQGDLVARLALTITPLGRASCRDRVSQYVLRSVLAGYYTQTTT